jgi:hypothetical protein
LIVLLVDFQIDAEHRRPNPSTHFMKRIIPLIVAIASILLMITLKPNAQEAKSNQSAAPRIGGYATIRFMEERTSIVLPDGTVETVMDLVPKKKFDGGEKYPKGSDYRMYWLTIAMNQLAQRGYELVQMNDKDVVMVLRFKTN